MYPTNESREDSEIKFALVGWGGFFKYNFEMVELVSYKGKERKTQLAPVSERLKLALLELWEDLSREERDLNARVFPSGSCKTAWGKVRSELKIENLRLRDLRRNFRTRLGKLGYSDDLAQRLLGHEQRQMTFHYAEADVDAVSCKPKSCSIQLQANKSPYLQYLFTFEKVARLAFCSKAST